MQPENHDVFSPSNQFFSGNSFAQDWATVMYRGVDTTGRFSGPRRDDDLWVSVYFVARRPTHTQPTRLQPAYELARTAE